jgi:hypothetical protein
MYLISESTASGKLGWGRGIYGGYSLQISLDLCIPEKELAKTRSQISFIYFQSHS